MQEFKIIYDEATKTEFITMSRYRVKIKVSDNWITYNISDVVSTSVISGFEIEPYEIIAFKIENDEVVVVYIGEKGIRKIYVFTVYDTPREPEDYIDEIMEKITGNDIAILKSVYQYTERVQDLHTTLKSYLGRIEEINFN